MCGRWCSHDPLNTSGSAVFNHQLAHTCPDRYIKTNEHTHIHRGSDKADGLEFLLFFFTLLSSHENIKAVAVSLLITENAE